jgi:hypothetical protein
MSLEWQQRGEGKTESASYSGEGEDPPSTQVRGERSTSLACGAHGNRRRVRPVDVRVDS